jgi:hypothetical protein
VAAQHAHVQQRERRDVDDRLDRSWPVVDDEDRACEALVLQLCEQRVQRRPTDGRHDDVYGRRRRIIEHVPALRSVARVGFVRCGLNGWWRAAGICPLLAIRIPAARARRRMAPGWRR